MEGRREGGVLGTTHKSRGRKKRLVALKIAEEKGTFPVGGEGRVFAIIRVVRGTGEVV